jgi:hypothetical protein
MNVGGWADTIEKQARKAAIMIFMACLEEGRIGFIAGIPFPATYPITWFHCIGATMANWPDPLWRVHNSLMDDSNVREVADPNRRSAVTGDSRWRWSHSPSAFAPREI